MENTNLQPEKKEWIAPVLTEESIADKTELSLTGAGVDGIFPGIMHS